MPVTARFSKKFYDKLGEDIAQEMVDWFNQVDATYSSNLRDLNDVNFARFDAKSEQRFAELDAKWQIRWSELDAKIDRRIDELDAKWQVLWSELNAKIDRRIDELDAKWQVRWSQLDSKIDGSAANLRTELHAMKAELIKWMFLFWLGTVTTVGALISLLH